MNLLEHVSTPIIESSIICEYLEDAYPEVSFRPNDPILKSQMRFWMKHVDVKLHPSCGAIQWPMIMRDSMLKRSEDERNVLLSKIPKKPRRERQKRLIQYGLDAPDVSDAVKTYYKTIVDMEKKHLANTNGWWETSLALQTYVFPLIFKLCINLNGPGYMKKSFQKLRNGMLTVEQDNLIKKLSLLKFLKAHLKR